MKRRTSEHDAAYVIRLALVGVFLAAIAVFILLALVVGLLLLGVGNRDQGRQNQRHIDCLVALNMPELPEECQSTIEHLEDEGFLPRIDPETGERFPDRSPPATTSPTPEESLP